MGKITVSYTGKKWGGDATRGKSAEATVGFEFDCPEDTEIVKEANLRLMECKALVGRQLTRKKAEPPAEPEQPAEPEPDDHADQVAEPPPDEPSGPANPEPSKGKGIAAGHLVPQCPVHKQDMTARESDYGGIWWTCPDRECREHYSQGSPGAKLCPECGAPMKIRDGKNGAFLGCTAYNSKTKTGCSYTENYERPAPPKPPSDDVDELADEDIPF
jgi:hypothetical protein